MGKYLIFKKNLNMVMINDPGLRVDAAKLFNKLHKVTADVFGISDLLTVEDSVKSLVMKIELDNDALSYYIKITKEYIASLESYLSS
jgi:hypothetical protein